MNKLGENPETSSSNTKDNILTTSLEILKNFLEKNYSNSKKIYIPGTGKEIKIPNRKKGS